MKDFDPSGLLAFARNYPKAHLLVIATDATPGFKRNYDNHSVKFLSLAEAVARLVNQREP